jgi:hypothetical protein
MDKTPDDGPWSETYVAAYNKDATIKVAQFVHQLV